MSHTQPTLKGDTMTTATIKTARLSGDTYNVRAILKSHGWQWDGDENVWTKDAAWTDESDVISSVRSYGGIRNRGSFSATIDA